VRRCCRAGVADLKIVSRFFAAEKKPTESCSNSLAGSTNPLAVSYGQLTADYDCGLITAKRFQEIDANQGKAVVLAVVTSWTAGAAGAFSTASDKVRIALVVGAARFAKFLTEGDGERIARPPRPRSPDQMPVSAPAPPATPPSVPFTIK
jgi:hypothetical protein